MTVDEPDALTAPFEEHRAHLRAVAYRMLGSRSEAEDAVQEAWLRLHRAGASGVENLRGWLTTVVSRVCLDMLRSRRSRREEPLEAQPERAGGAAADPESEAAMADSVGLALLVVLDTLAPAERLAFVLHDLFALPFEEIAGIVGRSPAAARQLASRARRRVQGAPAPDAELPRQRGLVDAFLAALRGGDVDALVAVLDPDVVIRADRGVAPPDGAETRGAASWARQAVQFSRAAQGAVVPALIDGEIGLALAPRGRVLRVLRFTIDGGRITEIDIVADPARLEELDVAVLPI
ncbi:MAG TPA: sigma-70 family RNA polymerase sigma factor [Kofleriaceae bacterium]|jgi:RNA polymerase sigma-70 factor (ECF subfamily)|nr:sigma-70 family RNA polymerase sigma factor [Kofleriaceae bacterium]